MNVNDTRVQIIDNMACASEWIGVHITSGNRPYLNQVRETKLLIYLKHDTLKWPSY